MKEFVIRLLLAAFLTFAALALSSSAQGRSVEDQSKTASREQQPKGSSRVASEATRSTLRHPSDGLTRLSALLNKSTSFRLR
jgi:hypothetical protein